MSTISTLTKKGVLLKQTVLESAESIFLQMNGVMEANDYESSIHANRDFILLTDECGNRVVINKRYIYLIEE